MADIPDFTPKDWRDYPARETPISAAALEDQETRVSTYARTVGEAVEDTLETALLTVASGVNGVTAEDGEVTLEPADIGAVPGSGALSGAPPVAVTNEMVWVTDPSLAGGADPTGVADSTAAFEAAIARAASITNGRLGSGHPLIGLPPGQFRLSNLYVPGDVGFVCSGRAGSSQLRFRTDTGTPTIGTPTGPVAANASSIPYTVRDGPGFATASTSAPRKALLGRHVISYTGRTGTATSGTLTGVTGVLTAQNASWTLSQGHALSFGMSAYGSGTTVLGEGIEAYGPEAGNASWMTATPPDAMDGVFMGDKTRIDCLVFGFRHATVCTADHQRWGSHFQSPACYSSIYMAPPDAAGGGGDQAAEVGASFAGTFWAGIYIHSSCALLNPSFGKAHYGYSPWAIWKESLRGESRDYPFILNYGEINSPSFEQIGLGVIGCGDGLSALVNARFVNPLVTTSNTYKPAGQTAVAIIAASLSNCVFTGPGMWQSLPSEMTAPIKAKSVAGGDLGDLGSILSTLLAQGKPMIAPFGTFTAQPSQTTFTYGAAVRGQIMATAAEAIAVNDVLGYRDVSVERVQRNPQALAGIAMLPAAASTCVPVQLSGKATANVVQRSTPPTGAAVTVSATAGTLPAGTYYYRVSAIFSGGGETGASAEISVALSGSNSASLSWSAPSTIPTGQTVTGYRLYRGTAASAEAGDVSVATTSYVDSGATLTGAAVPLANNRGCEVYGAGLVRSDSTQPGKVRIASGAGDTAGQPFAWTFVSPDNGATVAIRIAPALA